MTQVDTEPGVAPGPSRVGLGRVVARAANSVTPLRLALVTIVAVSSLWRLSVMVQWSWFQDDWVYMTDSVNMTFLEYVTQSYNGHLMPAQFALYWSWVQLDPLVYGWAIGTLWTIATASLVFWVLAFRELVGERPILLVAAVGMGLSPVFLPPALWTAAGMQTFSLQCAMGAALLFGLRWQRRQRLSDLMGLLISFGLGLLFWQKALLLVIPVLGVLAFRQLREGKRVLGRPMIIAGGSLLALSAAYLAVYLMATAEDAVERPGLATRSLTEIVQFYWQGLTTSAIPSLVGGPWTSPANLLSGTPAPSTTVQWILVMAAVAVVVGFAAYRRNSLVILAMAGGYVIVSWGLVLLSSRYTYIGSLGIQDARYVADSIPVLLVGIVLLVHPLRTVEVGGPFRTGAPRLGEERRSIVTVGVASLLMVSCFVSLGRMWDGIAPSSPQPWVTNAVRTMEAAGSTPIRDTVAPDPVALSWAFPEQSRLSSLMAPLRLDLRFDASGSRMIVLDELGRGTWGSFGDSAVSLPGPVPECGYLVPPGETAFVPMDEGMFSWEWGLSVSYYSRSGGTLLVSSDSVTTAMPLPAGAGVIHGVVIDSTTALRLSSTPGSGAICVDEVSVGLVTAGQDLVGS